MDVGHRDSSIGDDKTALVEAYLQVTAAYQRPPLASFVLVLRYGCSIFAPENFSTDDLVPVAEVLRVARHIAVIDLRGKHLGNGACFALADVLSHNPGTRALLLDNNDITHRGATVLCRGAMMNPSSNLEKLSLHGNSIGLGGATALARLVHSSASLRFLDVSCCSLTVKGVNILQLGLFARSRKSQPRDGRGLPDFQAGAAQSGAAAPVTDPSQRQPHQSVVLEAPADAYVDLTEDSSFLMTANYEEGEAAAEEEAEALLQSVQGDSAAEKAAAMFASFLLGRDTDQQDGSDLSAGEGGDDGASEEVGGRRLPVSPAPAAAATDADGGVSAIGSAGRASAGVGEGSGLRRRRRRSAARASPGQSPAASDGRGGGVSSRGLETSSGRLRVGGPEGVPLDALAAGRMGGGTSGVTIKINGNFVQHEVANSIVHGVGLALAIVGAVPLVARVRQTNDLGYFVGVILYLSGLLAFYFASTLRHSLFFLESTSRTFHIIDRSAVFVLIGGTYSPFLLVNLSGDSLASGLFVAMWALVIVGVWVSIRFRSRRTRSYKLVLYLLTGWFGVAMSRQVLRCVSLPGIALLLAGGAIYTAGAALYSQKSALPTQSWKRSVWYAFVLVASMMHYLAVFAYVGRDSSCGAASAGDEELASGVRSIGAKSFEELWRWAEAALQMSW